MGATGYTVFEDDMGADWTAGFLKRPSVETVRTLLVRAGSSRSLDDREAAAALCCAEMVAAGAGNPVDTMSQALLTWSRSEAPELAALGGEAAEAIETVRESSDLAEMWDGDPDWLAYLQDLESRLGERRAE